jgi:hypothetical protein
MVVSNDGNVPVSNKDPASRKSEAMDALQHITG